LNWDSFLDYHQCPGCSTLRSGTTNVQTPGSKIFTINDPPTTKTNLVGSGSDGLNTETQAESLANVQRQNKQTTEPAACLHPNGKPGRSSDSSNIAMKLTRSYQRSRK